MLKTTNRAISSLTTSVSDSDTAWVLTTGEGSKFPSSGSFSLTCENEITLCTARSADSLTVVRGQEGTQAAAHDAGKTVKLTITAALFNSVETDISSKPSLSEVKADTDIADAINEKHNNSLDHDGSSQNAAIAGKEPANANIQAHVTSAHAPSNAQKNSDITKAEIEAVLTGTISSHSHAGGGGLGYTISVQALTSSPADGATVYFGMLPKAPTTTANISKIYVRKAGQIKIAEILCYSGTAGTGQEWSLYIRKNNSADTLIATLSVAANEPRD